MFLNDGKTKGLMTWRLCVVLVLVVALFAIAPLSPIAIAQEGEEDAESPWNGEWNTEWGIVTLEVSDDELTGSYNYGGNQGVLEGEVLEDGMVVEGSWSQTPSNESGLFIFELAEDEQSWMGTWGVGESEDDGGVWTGTRIPAMSSWAGEWDTEWGVVTLEATTTQITGTYTYDGNEGLMQGLVSDDGKMVQGTWSQTPSNETGGFVFEIAEDGQSWAGTWGSGDSFDDGGAWTGIRKVSPWTGDWDTEWGVVTLEANAGQLIGSYAYGGNVGMMEGALSKDGLMAEGTWSQTPSNEMGRFIFQLGEDGQSWAGTWGVGDSADDGGAWTGKRVAQETQ